MRRLTGLMGTIRVLSITTYLMLVVSACDYTYKVLTHSSVDSDYAVWLTNKKMTANWLATQLKNDSAFADKLCREDANALQDYSEHYALISSPNQNRIDLAKIYNFDTNKPVHYSNTGKVIAENLGEFLEQKSKIRTDNSAVRHALKITFSKDGKFDGYCDNGNTSVVYIAPFVFGGEMKSYLFECDNPDAVLVCMSVK